MMRSRDPGILFSKRSILDVLENHKQKALDEIRNLSANQVMEGAAASGRIDMRRAKWARTQ